MNVIDLLEPSAICLGVETKDADSIVIDLSDRLLKSGYVKESFARATLEREKNFPTGLPLSGKYNAAIPHTDIEHVIKPALAIATLKEPVYFMNMVSPEEPVAVHVIFLLALDQPKSQVEMLQNLATILQNPQIVEALMEAKTYEEVYQLFGGSESGTNISNIG